MWLHTRGGSDARTIGQACRREQLDIEPNLRHSAAGDCIREPNGSVRRQGASSQSGTTMPVLPRAGQSRLECACCGWVFFVRANESRGKRQARCSGQGLTDQPAYTPKQPFMKGCDRFSRRSCEPS
jgi:hypothetical protein